VKISRQAYLISMPSPYLGLKGFSLRPTAGGNTYLRLPTTGPPLTLSIFNHVTFPFPSYPSLQSLFFPPPLRPPPPPSPQPTLPSRCPQQPLTSGTWCSLSPGGNYSNRRISREGPIPNPLTAKTPEDTPPSLPSIRSSSC